MLIIKFLISLIDIINSFSPSFNSHLVNKYVQDYIIITTFKELYVKKPREISRLLIYCKLALTNSFISLPSALPFTLGLITDIIFPISFIEVAPTSDIVSFTISFSSSSLNC